MDQSEADIDTETSTDTDTNTAIDTAIATEAAPGTETAPETETETETETASESAADRYRPLVALHGDFRLRLERWKNFDLGREDSPFVRFRSTTRGAMPEGACDPEAGCRDRPLRFATMRLRLAPEIHITENVSVHAMVDLFENFVLGSTPAPDPAFPERQGRAAETLTVRRAWARFALPGVAELRVGRMATHFGLGLVQNEGARLDDDIATEVDRLQLEVPAGPLVVFGAYDFAARGSLGAGAAVLPRVPFDPSSRDDARQWTLGAGRERSDDEANAALARGDVVAEGGAQLIGRRQDLGAIGEDGDRGPEWVRRGVRTYTPDLWLRLRYGGFRLEMEAAGHFGRIENAQPDGYAQDELRLRQVAVALDVEQRLLQGRLRIGGTALYASGDAEVGESYGRDGLSAAGDTATLFRAHESFRMDEILWRRIYGRIAGAWVSRIGARYDLLRDRRGRGLGLRLDAIYSRATAGAKRNLGLELDAGVEYGREDTEGREIFVGARYGLLIPLRGLRAEMGESQRAQALRLVLGARF